MNRLSHVAAVVAGPTSDVVHDGKSYNTETEPKTLLQQERASSTTNTREITYYLDGGQAKTEYLEHLMQLIARNPVFNNDDFYDLTKDQIREQTLARVGAINDILDTADDEDTAVRFSVASIACPSTITRIGVHFFLFVSSVKTLGRPSRSNTGSAKERASCAGSLDALA